MGQINNKYLDKGVYSIPEIAKLAQTDAQLIRRWLSGYSYKKNEKSKFRSGLFEPEFGKIDGNLIFSFHDLIEVLFVVEFKNKGVRLPIIRQAFLLAQEQFHSKHPFSNLKFKTDGKYIFEEAYRKGKSAMTNLNTKQMVFSKIIEQTLFKALEFDNNEASVWYPLYPSRKIVVDPERAFGRPILANSGVPVDIINAAYQADGSYKFVASDFDIHVDDVRAAVKFENTFH